MRKYAREVTFSLTFEYLFTKTKNDLGLDLFEKKHLTGDDVDYITKTYDGVVEQFDALQEKAASLAKGYKLDRIYKVDLAILILAIYELSNTDVPAEVCINEAVDIAKVYDDVKAPRFINGILNKVARATGKISDAE